LSVRLIVRGAQGVGLSEAGELIRDYVVTMERSAQAIERLALGRDKREEGRVRISAPDGLAAFWLAPKLPEFQRENPKISVSLDAGLWPRDDIQGETDLSLRFEESKHPDDVVTRLATYHYCLFASPDYIQLYGAPRTLAEVADHRVVHHIAQRHQSDSWHPKAGALQAMWNRQIETNSSAAALIAIRSGAGIGALPTAALTVAPELVMIGDAPLAKIMLWLVHHRDARNVERTRRVMDWLKGIFDPRANPWYREEYVAPADFPAATADEMVEPLPERRANEA
jgi:DNA-binding transcriptional LysR family regulator